MKLKKKHENLKKKKERKHKKGKGRDFCKNEEGNTEVLKPQKETLKEEGNSYIRMETLIL